MDVILTHEQADFDALAAQLGAYIMNENAIPILSRRLNRNVRAFLTLYGADLPFIEARDLPAGPINTITLVDTQSLVTLKGMSHNTSVQVVDHHSLRSELPESWSVTVEPVGACTTLFAEGLREHDGTLNSVYATLLLLGIYEDTGSLTYTSTTARDIRAAASLLEQGASLKILSHFLNPPLTDEQRQVYDRLLSTAERHVIHGQNILVAQANAEDTTDEISTIAHKLRDLLDPDALILIVRTVEGIRIVARSVTDLVNVSKIAEHFGGGGHDRAAAALVRVSDMNDEHGHAVKKPSLDEIHTELLSRLPDYVRPSLVVRQIMSPGPLIITPGTQTEQAAQLMQRYGYEGFPVVDQGKVRGLLTRRAVDRAISHRLNLPASSLMESGEITVSPNDSIEQLRKVMVDSGWGQIPVVNPETGQIVGIVTRTDLLKTADFAPAPGRQNLAGRLEEVLSPTRLALLKTVAATAYDLHMAVYIVGGFVRDLIINRPSPDFDIVVEGDAIALAKAMVRAYGGKIQTHGRFGTAKWTIVSIRSELCQAMEPDKSLDPDSLPDSLDMISARTEFYDYPTALPTIERSSIKHDLHRRDFTINTMALRLDGRHYGDLYDYWGGLRDLRRGLVRVLHSLSFVDDPTRMMRAIRFEQRFGYEIEGRTQQLIQEARPLVRQVSGDRLRHELNLILNEERCLSMLKRLQTLGLLAAIHPILDWREQYDEGMIQSLHGSIPPEWELPDKLGNLPLRLSLAYLTWLTHYPWEEACNAAERLRMPADILDCLIAYWKLTFDLPEMTGMSPSVLTNYLEGYPNAALFLVKLLNPSSAIQDLLFQYQSIWRITWPVTNGTTLREMNVQPGPQYKQILSALRSAWLDGKIHSVQEEKAFLLETVRQQGLTPSSPE